MPPPPPPFVCRCVKSLLYGGDNVTVPDPNPQKSANFRVKLGKVRASACNTAPAHMRHCIAHLHFIPLHLLRFTTRVFQAYVDAAIGPCPANPSVVVNDDGC